MKNSFLNNIGYPDTTEFGYASIFKSTCFHDNQIYKIKIIFSE